jgi:WD40 repeat protein
VTARRVWLAALLLLAACGSGPAVSPDSVVQLVQERRLMLGDRPAREVAFSPDGAILATSSADGTLALWPTHRRGKPRLIRQPAIASLAFSPDSAAVATGSYDGRVRIWRAADGALPAGNHTYAVAFSPDGSLLASAGRARGAVGTFLHQLTGAIAPGPVLRLWDVRTGTLLAAAPQPEDAMSVAFSPDRAHLATASEDGTVTLWSVGII